VKQQAASETASSELLNVNWLDLGLQYRTIKIFSSQGPLSNGSSHLCFGELSFAFDYSAGHEFGKSVSISDTSF
jgi:hypothetical protein